MTWDFEIANPVKESINVPTSNTCSGDWYLEAYRIRKHKLGGYSAFVQAGNRSAGGSRTFFIPASYFKQIWDDFLDKYLELVPPALSIQTGQTGQTSKTPLALKNSSASKFYYGR